MSRLTGLFVVAMVTVLVLGPGLAVATEDPRFETTVNEQYVTPGHTQSLAITLLNDAENPDDTVERATNVKAELVAGESPFTVTSGPVHLGTVEDGVPKPVQFTIDVPQDVNAGTYTLPIEVTYEYEGDERETTTTHVQVTVSDRARFAIVDASSDLHVASEGSLTVTVQNIGSEPATDGTLKMESRSSVMAFEGAQSGVRSVGELDPGENRTLTYAMSATDVAEPDLYPAVGTVRYDDEEQNRHSSRALATTVSLTREQTFAVTTTATNLQVNREGVLEVSVKNTGPKSVENTNVRIDTEGTGLHPTQPSIAIGNLDPGENRSARFEIFVDEDTTVTARQVTAQIEYIDENGDQRNAHPTRLDVPVEPEEPIVAISSVGGGEQLQVDREQNFTVQVTNNGSETIKNANLILSEVGTGLQPTQTDLAIGDLDPGETRLATFEIGVASGTMPSARQLAFTVNYEEMDGDIRKTDPNRMDVDVKPDKPVLEIEQANETGSLRVDREQNFTITITNPGETRVENANVILDSSGTGLQPTQTEIAIGDLRPDETTTATYEITVDDDTTPSDRQLIFQVDYEEPDGDTRRTDPERLQVGVEPDYPVFAVTPVENEVPAGKSEIVRFEVTNNGPMTLSSVNVKAYTDAPVSISDDAAYINQLEPNESTVISLKVDAPGEAQVKAYPISLDFQYDEPDGDTKLSDTYDQPVSVVERTTLTERLSAFIADINIPTNLLLGGFAGIVLSGLGMLLVRTWYRNNE